ERHPKKRVEICKERQRIPDLVSIQEHRHRPRNSLTIKSQNSSLKSIPTAVLPVFRATLRVVPVPANGSSTRPFLGHPISRHRSTISSGYAAAWIPPFERRRAEIIQMSSSPLRAVREK